RVPGLVDSVADGVNGWLLDDPRELPDALDVRLRMLADVRESELIAERCRRWAGRFTWERSALRMADVVVGAQPEPGHTRRSLPSGWSDVATVVVLEGARGLEALRPRMLPSDLWAIEGSTLRVLLQGQDQVFAGAQALLLVCGTAAATSAPWVLSQRLARASTPAVGRDTVTFAVVLTVGQGLLAALVVGMVAAGLARGLAALPLVAAGS